MSLLNLLADNSPLLSSSVLCFYGNEYPLLFFSLLIKRLKQQTFPIVAFDYCAQEHAIFEARASTTFLGSSSVFWLNNCSLVEQERKTRLMHFLDNYRGPHRIWFYDLIAPSELPKENIVEVPDLVTQYHYDQLVALLYEPLLARRIKAYSTAYFATIESITLEQACLLMHYGLLMGNEHKQFTTTWLPHVIPCEKSLFTLSQHFFGHQEKNFFGLWQNIRKEYPDQFWISFWSEQLFRGFQVISYMHKKEFAQAKAIAFRLPFSLMQSDWKKNKPIELLNAHQFLYQVDYGLKNNGSNVGIDLFFSKFFLGEFATSHKN